MRLSPREVDKLALHAAGALAQKRLARGVRLNHPEATALVASVLLELIRDGRDGENYGVAQLMDLGRKMLGKRHVLPAVLDTVLEVQVEGTFPDGTKLLTVHHPISALDGDLDLALHGSCLPAPDLAAFGDAESLAELAMDGAVTRSWVHGSGLGGTDVFSPVARSREQAALVVGVRQSSAPGED